MENTTLKFRLTRPGTTKLIHKTKLENIESARADDNDQLTKPFMYPEELLGSEKEGRDALYGDKQSSGIEYYKVIASR